MHIHLGTMDIFDFCHNRKINPEEVFDQASPANEGIRGTFMRLKNVLISELHATWDIVFLERYIKEKMIPRSLRWNVYPDKGDTEIKEWYLYFNDVGIAFLEFLVAKKRSKVAKLQLEISDIKEKLAPRSKEGLYQVYMKELHDIMIEEEEGQKNNKLKKYLRDVEDYKSHNIFKWHFRSLQNTPTPIEIQNHLEEGVTHHNKCREKKILTITMQADP